MIISIGGRHIYQCRLHEIVMRVLNNVFNFRFGSHWSGSHNFCPLVILANCSLGHKAASGPAHRLVCPV